MNKIRRVKRDEKGRKKRKEKERGGKRGTYVVFEYVQVFLVPLPVSLLLFEVLVCSREDLAHHSPTPFDN